MKTTEQVNKEFDEKWPVVFYDRSSIVQDLKSFISSLRKNDIEALEEWLEKYEVTRGVSQSGSYDIGQNHGRQGMRADILSHLQELKNKI